MKFSNRFSKRVQNIKPIAIRKVSKRIKQDFIFFAAGMPAPALFPIATIGEKAQQVLDIYGPSAVQYSDSQGFLTLRTWLADRLQHTIPENVLIISGSQQAIDLVSKLFLDPGDKIVVSSPTYVGALSSFNVYGVEYLGVATDKEGMLPDQLEAALKLSPKLIYCIPNFMNPTGIDMSLERRQQLVELAQKYNVPIFEDDPYGALRFEGEAVPNLYDLAPEQVIYAGTFSKILAPGFRLGWLAAPQEVIQPLINAKQAADLQTSIFNQMLVYEVSRDGFIDAHIERIRSYYHQQRDCMVQAVEQFFPKEIAYTQPKGGFFLWIELPEEQNATELLEEALEAKVAYVPGTGFYPNGGGQHTIRLSYSLVSQTEIETGMRKLGTIFERALRSKHK